MKYISIFIGLVMSNFLFQYMTANDYSVAIERTFFQGVALLLAWQLS